MQKVKALWLKLPLELRHVIHTFWQVGLPVLTQQLLLAHSSADVRAAFVVAGSTGLAAAKAALVQ